MKTAAYHISCISLLQVLHAAKVIEGFHIQIRDDSPPSSAFGGGGARKKATFDVVTISGGGTRSHTLSDLRPNSRYDIFVIPYSGRIKGVPSNMATVTTKEDGTYLVYKKLITSLSPF